ncbi:hypothetical protein HMPREF3198_00756 [Winkia neuii]|nr:hypothetical protein HMPREF3198_00756 [Winkia neuii]
MTVPTFLIFVHAGTHFLVWLVANELVTMSPLWVSLLSFICQIV